jgi:hypothetical protein
VFHLRYFADANGAVWVHDRADQISPNPKPLLPEAIANEDELYTVRASEESDKSDQIERWLSDSVDTPAARALASVTKGRPPAADEKIVFARYIASRDVRTPRFRDFVLSFVQAGIDSYQKALAEDVSGFRERLRESLGEEVDNYSDEEIRNGIRLFKAAVRKEYWLMFLIENLEKVALRLAAEGWRALHVQDCHLITSDLGILKHRGDFSKAAPHMPGWWNQAPGWIIPLTPLLAVMLAPGLLPGDSIALPDFTERVNRDLAMQADRFVFSDRAEPSVLELWGV